MNQSTHRWLWSSMATSRVETFCTEGDNVSSQLAKALQLLGRRLLSAIFVIFGYYETRSASCFGCHDG